MTRTYAGTIEMLRRAGLRPTRQRVGLGHLLFSHGDRHVTADQLRGEAEAVGLKVSLATVYNTLHQFSEAGLLSEVVVEPGRSYFDTNTGSHHHFFNLDSGELLDIPEGEVAISALPKPPAGTAIDDISIVVRVRHEAS